MTDKSGDTARVSIRKDRFYFLMRKLRRTILHLVLIGILIIVLVPVVWVIIASFVYPDKLPLMMEYIKSVHGIKGLFTVKNYSTLINADEFLYPLRNSLLISAGTATLSTFLGFLAGYAFSRYNFPGRKFSLLWVLITQLFPLAMMIVPFLIIATRLKITNTLWGLSLAYTATTLPFSIWMLKSFFDTIPVDIEEAAEVDGTTTGQKLLYIIFPLTRPAIATSFLFSFITAWNEYAVANMFMTSVEKYTIPVALKSFLDQGDPRSIALFTAAAVLVSFPVVILFIYMRHQLVAGMTMGAVKG